MAVTSDDIRNLLMERDIDDNPVLGDLDFEDEDIDWAITRAVSYWNESPPIIRPVYSDVDDFPYTYHLSLGAAGELMLAKAHKLQRNRIPVQGENLAADTRARADYYIQMGREMVSEYRNWVLRTKCDIDARGFVSVIRNYDYN